MIELEKVSLLVDKYTANDIYSKGLAEIALRRSDARFSSMIKCAVLSNGIEDENDVLSKIMNAINSNSIGINELRKDFRKMSSDIFTLNNTCKKIAVNVDKIYAATQITKVLSFLNVGLSLVNLSVNVTGFVIIKNKLCDIKKELCELSDKVDKIFNVNKSEKIAYYEELIMRFNSMVEEINSGRKVDIEKLEKLTVDLRTFIFEMINNLKKNAIEPDVLLSIIYSLFPAYSLLLISYLKMYYFKYKKKSPNYDMYLSIYMEMLDDKLLEYLEDYYCLEKEMSFAEVRDAVISGVYIIINNMSNVEDEMNSLEILKTQKKYNEFEREIDRLAKEEVENSIGEISTIMDLPEEHLKTVFSIAT